MTQLPTWFVAMYGVISLTAIVVLAIGVVAENDMKGKEKTQKDEAWKCAKDMENKWEILNRTVKEKDARIYVLEKEKSDLDNRCYFLLKELIRWDEARAEYIQTLMNSEET